ncbi:MAG: ABC transporter ATP-binding protein [Armatimonadota bacterium]|nr:ABC transporter ATP-binding protein [Armatimonadota bacterium]MDR7422162.1 ABC transporter ATP-binding protein [Armatimonadota bacterium]MDR7455107.1 ABC transporter ATP-binding protein [Armatimonadota bacterium]MDR7456052.1 ABC transporter ATP-binding protein [Armatimonadota bacterium]MDR7495386.1 ABC transporter ATP-binding protein [Armatimonadota bacterium]
MPSVRMTSLVKIHRVGRQVVRAADGVSLEAPQGQILTLLGPSGCGKSTTLRCVAGLERPDDGEILFGDRVVFSRARRVFVPPEGRNVGMVFQSYAIWPHLTVFENVAYPMDVRGVPRRRIQERVAAALDLVGLGALADRPAPYLSGGQQQRVALARALVYEPEVLLLDEPLSNLDAKVREQVREDLRGLQRRLGITTIYVTHDQLEALSLSDVIAVMQAGRIVEVGTPQALYARPTTRFTAAFLGEISFLSGAVAGREGGMLTIMTPSGPLRCRDAHAVPDGTPVVAGARPEHVTLTPDRPAGAASVFEGTVASALYEGGRVKYRVGMDGLTVLAYGAPRFAPGDRVHVAVDPDQVIVLPDLAGPATRPMAPGSPAGPPPPAPPTPG